MDSRERVLRALKHKEADRVPIQDSLWATTVERWQQEGMPRDIRPEDYFDFEMEGFKPDTSFLLPGQVVEETEDAIIATNAWGVTQKNWKRRTSTPEFVKFSVTSRERWEERKDLLVFKPERILREQDAPLLNAARNKGRFVHFSAAVGYDKFSSIVGPETLLPALLLEPDWVYEMFETHVRLVLECAEEMFGMGYDFDGAFFFDDLGYKNGVFFSTAIYREILQPHHKRLCDFFHGRGCPVILHSCGNVIEHIPALIEAGFDCLQALEVKAGMDLPTLKKDFGDRLAFMGGIDVRAMMDPDPRRIEEEIRRKIPAAMKGGGYIYHSDHTVPDGVSLSRFQMILDLVRTWGRFS